MPSAAATGAAGTHTTAALTVQRQAQVVATAATDLPARAPAASAGTSADCQLGPPRPPLAAQLDAAADEPSELGADVDWMDPMSCLPQDDLLDSGGVSAGGRLQLTPAATLLSAAASGQPPSPLHDTVASG